jgi:CopG family transcriptional regulator/antitoxin EndoAI
LIIFTIQQRPRCKELITFYRYGISIIHIANVYPNMYQRINITLPNETLQLLDRIAPKGDRSHFIDQAVKYYINAEAKKNLREKLKQGALRRADRDLGITQDWFNIDEESWQNGK